MSSAGAKGKRKRVASTSPQLTPNLPNSPPTSPEKRIKLESTPKSPQYASGREAMNAQHKLYATVEQIGKTPDLQVKLKQAGSSTNYNVSVGKKKTFFIVGQIGEHNMSIELPSVHCLHLLSKILISIRRPNTGKC
jgi:hypothetical protein